ncbi:Plant transposase (Ptta/En/Spm family) [Carex littledalei]|uniref:Plant transposase (Ptta/En/Spm family) n=1 Tax=Carex littledalei TaxID=544730 RepID=A0A833QZ91_9POAL|nr:Plant transposase (Ptta/En/Spm family) [Carex littledalei]
MAGTDNVQRRKSKRLNPSIDPAPPPTQAATPAPQPPPTQAMTHPPQPPTQAETPSPKPPATLAATSPSDPSLRKPNGKPNINRRTSTRSLTGGSDLSGPIATAVQSLPKPGARVTIPAPAFTPLSDVLPPDLTDNIISMDEVDTVQRRKSARLNPSTEPGPSPPEWTPKLLTRPPLPPRKGVIADPSPPPTQAATPAPQPPTQAATPAPQPPLTQEETPAPPPPIQAATPSPQPPPIQAATPSPQPQPIQAATPAPPPPIQAATPSPQPQPTQAATPPPLPLTQEATPAPPPPIQAATPSPQPQPTQAATPPPQPPPTQAATAARAPGKLKQKGKSPPERRISSRECDPAVRRRSKRLNPGDEDVPPLTGTAPEKVASTPQPPPEPQETTPLSAPLSSQTRSESVSSAKIFFGPNPTNPRLKPKKRVEEGQNSHMADEGLSESPHTPEGFVSSPSPQRSNLGEAGAAASPPSEQVSDWSDWEQDITSESQPAFKSAATQSAPQGTVPENSHGPELSEQSMGQQAAVEDDGGRRFRMRRPLRACPEAFGLSGRELDEAEAKVPSGKKRARPKKGKKDVQPRGRGLAKIRDPAKPQDRPEVFVVGDGEFTSSPKCTKLVSTIRLLTTAEMPGPCRTYNMFPSSARLVILRRFLERYSWGAEEDEARCLDVFENIAAETYTRMLNKARSTCKKKYGPVKELWKEYCPPWCLDLSHWKGLCDIWSHWKWDQLSCTNRDNQTKMGRVVHHVGGSRSTYKHKEAMIAEKGPSVGLVDVFDRLHTRNTDEGKVYVNDRAKDVGERYQQVKKILGHEYSDEALWVLAADGEDRRGRVFGFGNKARTSKANRELQAMEASGTDPTKSTATSAEDAKKTFTDSEVARLVNEKILAERRAFAQEIAAQEERHRAEMADVKKQNKWSNICIDALFKATGTRPPPIDEELRGQDGGGDASDLG